MVSTDQYLSKVNIPVPFEDKVFRWFHDHPTTMKIIKWTGAIGGAIRIASIPLAISTVGFSAIWLGVGGLIFLISSLALHILLDLVIGPHHNMSNHAFKESKCDGGRLYYEGDVPVLEISSDDPNKAGYAHGFLLADSIQVLRRRYHFAVHTLAKASTADELPRVLAEVKKTLPPEYITEMEGLRDGFNARIKDMWFKPKAMTFDEILLFHLAPDSCHFNPEKAEGKIPAQTQPAFAPACTVVVSRNREGEPILMRNMDWPSIGVFGKYSLVIHRKHEKEGCYPTVEVGIPGLIGTLTGINYSNDEKQGSGMALAMNSCHGNTTTIQGTPASLYNRYCLEHFNTIDKVEEYVSTQRPLGAYHLIVADSKTAASFHLDQGNGKTYLKTILEDQPLVVTNYFYSSTSNGYIRMNHMFDSDKREEVLHTFFKDAQAKIAEDQLDMEKLLQKSRSFSFVDNMNTTHSMMMRPARREIDLAFNNGYAGSNPLHPVRFPRM